MLDWQRLPDEAYRWEVVVDLMRHHGEAIMQYCLAWLGEGLAEEVTQEVFVSAWQQLPKYRPEASLRTWVFGIAQHKCQQAYRNRARRRAIAQTFGDEIRQRAHGGEAPIPGDEGDHAALARLNACFAKLGAEERILLSLRYWKGLPLADIAGIIRMSVKTVQRRLKNAEECLKELMHATP
ncbi:MAG TPA: sigma-70 family RNA polymerase sigma factor [Candidatus Tectomicrobia bacterium]